jgi:hypothetical protein
VGIHLAGKHATKLELTDLPLDRLEVDNDIGDCALVIVLARKRIELARLG